MSNEIKKEDVITNLLQGMENFLSSKTVVGEPVKVGDTTLIPLSEVSFGIAAGRGAGEKKKADRGGMGGKLSPVAVLVIKDGKTRIINIKNQDAVTKILDIVPEFIGRFTEPKDTDNNLTNEEALDIAFDRTENS